MIGAESSRGEADADGCSKTSSSDRRINVATSGGSLRRRGSRDEGEPEDVSPAPVAVIHSTRDEYVPVGEARQLLEAARNPKRLWVVDASDHRFSGNLPEFDRRLLEAVAWVHDHAVR